MLSLSLKKTLRLASFILKFPTFAALKLGGTNSKQPYNHTTIQPYNHTTIQPYIQPYNHTTIQPYNHTTFAIIPARYASSRLPGKPLLDIGGKSMIRRVYERAKKSALLTEVYVATDDTRIFEHVHSFGARAVMTAIHHQNGTERCAEALDLIPHSPDIIINLQGDEPFIQTEQIDDLVRIMMEDGVELGTLVKEIESREDLFDRSIPKVVLNKRRDAVYFSRQCIPFLRNVEEENWLKQHTFYKHIGIYAYRIDTLKAIVQLSPGKLERAESLEQLRWIEHGFSIRAGVTTCESLSIDTPRDLEKARKKAHNF